MNQNRVLNDVMEKYGEYLEMYPNYEFLIGVLCNMIESRDNEIDWLKQTVERMRKHETRIS